MAGKGSPLRLQQIKSPGNILQDEHQDCADAKRVVLVDECGDVIDATNPLPVDAIINLNVSKPGDYEIFNIPLADKTQAYQIAFTEKTVRWKLRVRDKKLLQVAENNTEIDTKYWTVIPGNILQDSDLYLEGKSMYVKCPRQDNVTLEFWVWIP